MVIVMNLKDMWDVLKDYPAARVRLEAIASKRLEKYRKEPLQKSKNLFLSPLSSILAFLHHHHHLHDLHVRQGGKRWGSSRTIIFYTRNNTFTFLFPLELIEDVFWHRIVVKERERERHGSGFK